MAASLVLGGCSRISVPGVYRLDIQQGNVVTEEMLSKLERGMEKRKVRFILGTPAITDAFNQERWDYVFSFQPGGGRRSQRRISLLFEKGKLMAVEGDVKPATAHAAEPRRRSVVVEVPEQRDDRGLLSTVLGRLRKDEKRVREPAAKHAESKPSPSEKEDGFFKRLVRRFRLPGKSEPGEAAAETGTQPQPATGSGD